MRFKASSCTERLRLRLVHRPGTEAWALTLRRHRSRPSQAVVIIAAAAMVVGGCSIAQDDTAGDAAETTPTVTAATSTTTGPTATATEEPPDPATTMIVTFDGTECSFDGPSELPTGTVTLVLVNNSDGDAGLSMGKLRDGVTVEQVRAFYAQEFEERKWSDRQELYDPEQGEFGPVTAPGEVDPGGYSFYAQPGQWVLVCGPFKPWTSLPGARVAGGVSITE